MKGDENGVGLYEASDIQSANSWTELLNKGQDSLSRALSFPQQTMRNFPILTARDAAEQTDLLNAHRLKYGIPADDNNPLLVYRYDLDMLMACGTRWTRVGGHAMHHHRLLTRRHNFLLRSQDHVRLGEYKFTLHADAEIVLGLSAVIVPPGWASGYFQCWLSGSGGYINPYGYWSSQQTDSRFAYYREWVGQGRRGQNTVLFEYEHTKDSPDTVMGTVWAFVRYASG